MMRMIKVKWYIWSKKMSIHFLIHFFILTLLCLRKEIIVSIVDLSCVHVVHFQCFLSLLFSDTFHGEKAFDSEFFYFFFLFPIDFSNEAIFLSFSSSFFLLFVIHIFLLTQFLFHHQHHHHQNLITIFKQETVSMFSPLFNCYLYSAFNSNFYIFITVHLMTCKAFPILNLLNLVILMKTDCIWNKVNCFFLIETISKVTIYSLDSMCKQSEKLKTFSHLIKFPFPFKIIK